MHYHFRVGTMVSPVSDYNFNWGKHLFSQRDGLDQVESEGANS